MAPEADAPHGSVGARVQAPNDIRLVMRRKSLAGSLIGSLAEGDIAPDVQTVPIRMIKQAHNQ